MSKQLTRRGARAVGAAAILGAMLLGSGPALAVEAPPQSGGEDRPAVSEVVGNEGGGSRPLTETIMGWFGKAPQGEAPTESVSGDVYDDPTHEDVTYYQDGEGNTFEARSGITHWEKRDPNAPMAMSDMAITEILKATITPETGTTADHDGQQVLPVLKVDLTLPADAQPGDAYVVDLNMPWAIPGGTNIEIKDPRGHVFGIATPIWTYKEEVEQSWASQLKITLTDYVAEATAITGFVSVQLTYAYKNVDMVEPIIATADGEEIGRSGDWTITKGGQLGGGCIAHGGVPGVGEYSDKGGILPSALFFISDMKDDEPTVVTFTGWKELGLIPTGGSGITTENNNSYGYMVARQYEGPGADPIIDEANGTVSYSVTKAEMLAFTGTEDAIVAAREVFWGDPKTEYKVKIDQSGLETPYGNCPLDVPALSGNATTEDAQHLTLNTAKSYTIEGAHDGDKAQVGDTINYTITVSPGPENQTVIDGLTVTDTVPTEIEFISAGQGGTYDAAKHEVVWTAPYLTSTNALTFAFQGKVTEEPANQEIINTVATSTAGEVCSEGTTTGHGSTCEAEVTTPVGKPGFGFVKESEVEDTNGNGYLGDAGDTIIYTFKVTNTGDVTLTTALLNDTLLGISDHECLSEPLAPGATTTCEGEFKHVIDAADVEAGEVHNEATLCLDPDYGLACEPGETTTVTKKPAYTFEKHSQVVAAEGERGFEGATAGDKIDYWFTVSNTGNVDLHDVTIDDDLLDLDGAPCVAELPVGAENVKCETTKEYTITDADVEAGEVVNHATAHVPGLPDEPGETTNPVVDPKFEFAKRSKVSIVGDHGYSGAYIGDKIDYSFTVTNTGNVALHDVTITDDLLGLKNAVCVAELPVGAENVK